MSQYVKVKCKVLDNVKPALVRRAVQSIRKGLDVKPKKITSGILDGADAVLLSDGVQMNIGFKFDQENGKTSMTVQGDFWHTGFRKDDFIHQLCHNYQLLNVQDMVRENRWNILSTKTEEDDTIVLRIAV